MKLYLIEILCIALLATGWIASSEAFSSPTKSLTYGLPLVAVSFLSNVGLSFGRSKGSNQPKGGHDTNKRPSNREKHEKGDERRRRDQERSKKNPYRRG